MDIQQLKYFKAVAEAGKISDAADSLFISAPALSMAISRLEKELGVQLFDRTNNRIILNRQGEIFLRYARQTLSALEYTKQEIHQSMAGQRHHVSFGCISATQWVDLIAAFTQEHPDFTMSCIPVSFPDLADGGWPAQANLLLAAEEDVPVSLAGEIESMVLFEDRPYAMVHKDHPLAQKESVSVSELRGENLFLPMPGDSLCHHLERLFLEEEVPFPTGNCYSYLMAQRMAATGVGVAFATAHFVKDPTLAIRYIPISHSGSRWVFRLYWRKNRPLTKDEAALKDFAGKYYLER